MRPGIERLEERIEERALERREENQHMGDTTVTLGPNYTSAGRTFLLHMPIRRPPGKPPLFIGLCGGGSNGQTFASVTGMAALADANGFAVAFPNPDFTAGGGQVWNAPPCFTAPGDDVQFVARDLPAFLAAQEGIDLSRVYLFGFSAGDILCWKIWREASDKIAAFVSHSGDVGLGQYSPAPKFAQPYLYIRGMVDSVNPIIGGVGQDSQGGCNHASMALSVQYGTQWNGCKGGAVSQFPGYTQTDYAGAAPFRLVEVADAGHAWVGQPMPSGIPYTPGIQAGNPNATQPVSRAFSASQMAVEWCLPHTLAG